jgi:hypothetical protein
VRSVVVLFYAALSGFLFAAETRPEAEAPTASNPADPAEVICTVNGESIRRQQVEDRMPPVIVAKLIDLRRRLIAAGRSETEAQETVDTLHAPVFRQALRDSIRERLMLQEARRQDLQISELLFSENFEREWDALKERKLADQPGHEEKTVRERVRARLTLQAFRRQPAVRQDEDAWFKDVLKRSTVLDGGHDGAPLAMSFFFPNEGPKKTPAPDEPQPGASKPATERL